MTVVSAVSGVSIGGELGAIGALPAPGGPMIETGKAPVIVDPVLLRALRAAGIEQCADNRRLSGEQFEHLVQFGDRPTRDRLQLRKLVFLAGVQPAGARE